MTLNIEGPINANVINVYDQLPIGGEFLGFFGDCTEDAYMVAVKACDPRRPATRAELDRLTSEAIQASQTTSPQGAMTAANLAWLCQKEGVPYAQHDGSWFRNGLGGQGGYGTWPVVLQVGNGSALPGGQGGVNGHAVTILAWDGGQARATIYNGDSANGLQGQLDVVGFSDIDNAQPFALTEIRLPRPIPAPPIDRAGIISHAQAIIQAASA